MKDNATCDGVYILRSVTEDAVKTRLGEWEAMIEAEAATIPQQRTETPPHRVNDSPRTANAYRPSSPTYSDNSTGRPTYLPAP